MSTFTKIVHLQSEALPIFYQFVSEVRTSTWINGIELGDKSYSNKPTDGSRREVIIWQGHRNGDHQKVTFKFIYSGDHGWCRQGLVFSGRNGGEEWSQAFRFYEDYDGRMHFIPCILEHGWYPKDYRPEEAEPLYKRWFKRI